MNEKAEPKNTGVNEPEAVSLDKLMEQAFIANGMFHAAMKQAGISRAERRRALRMVTRGIGGM